MPISLPPCDVLLTGTASRAIKKAGKNFRVSGLKTISK
jgi:hypothetical protein